MSGSAPDVQRSKWYVPVVCLTLFTFCFGGGWLWGGVVKSPARPALVDLPLYPDAQSVVIIDPSGKPVGLASPSPTPGIGGILLPGVRNFRFVTPDSPQAVVDYYRSKYDKIGFYSSWLETPTPQSMKASFIRENESFQIEIAHVSATIGESGQTEVQVTLEVRSQQ